MGKVKIIIIFNATKLRIYLYHVGLPVVSAYFEILPEHKFQFQLVLLSSPRFAPRKVAWNFAIITSFLEVKNKRKSLKIKAFCVQ